MIDRSFKIDFETFKKGWLKMFEGKSEEELKAMFDAMDDNQDGCLGEKLQRKLYCLGGIFKVSCWNLLVQVPFFVPILLF